MICGIDEAGRGPVIGPMVIAGVQVKDEKVLDGFRIRDSKKCSPERRERLADTIKSKADKIHIVVFDADEIDELRKRFTINEIEVEGFCRVMRVLRSDRYYVDSADVDEKRFANELRRRLDFDAEIISSHKAEEKFVVVAAASIIAKTERDRFVREIEKELREKLDMPLGSGYPSDSTTIEFLKEWIKRYGKLPPHVRKSWKTIRKLSGRQSKLW
ncbi:MAG TPA: ribonuclease HII [Thermoplasmatales archaeon]|nr:ribonuclease HII [Thermoplasmatales archaeon]